MNGPREAEHQTETESGLRGAESDVAQPVRAEVTGGSKRLPYREVSPHNAVIFEVSWGASSGEDVSIGEKCGC